MAKKLSQKEGAWIGPKHDVEVGWWHNSSQSYTYQMVGNKIISWKPEEGREELERRIREYLHERGIDPENWASKEAP